MTIKPIETEYNGYRFRSRLEARWAVFFDNAGIEYEYETEGYELQNGNRYLPDFYLPSFDLHVEVKRNTLDGIKEIERKSLPAIKWGGPIKQLLILSNIPEPRSIDGGLWHFPIAYWSATFIKIGWWFFHGDSPPLNGGISGCWNYYPRKDISATSDAEFRSTQWPYSEIKKSKTNEEIRDDIRRQESSNKLVFESLQQARQARFEHGEKPMSKAEIEKYEKALIESW